MCVCVLACVFGTCELSEKCLHTSQAGMEMEMRVCDGGIKELIHAGVALSNLCNEKEAIMDINHCISLPS